MRGCVIYRLVGGWGCQVRWVQLGNRNRSWWWWCGKWQCAVGVGAGWKFMFGGGRLSLRKSSARQFPTHGKLRRSTQFHLKTYITQPKLCIYVNHRDICDCTKRHKLDLPDIEKNIITSHFCCLEPLFFSNIFQTNWVIGLVLRQSVQDNMSINSWPMYIEEKKFGLSLDPPGERQEKAVATALRLSMSYVVFIVHLWLPLDAQWL